MTQETVTRYLLDTHVLLWWLGDPTQLSESAQSAIGNGGNEVYVSAAAAWEMAIKKRLGRLDFPSNLVEVLRDEHINVLPIGMDHALGVSDLPLHHQDPFDRMMVSQAKIEGLTLITRDDLIPQYGVRVLRA